MTDEERAVFCEVAEIAELYVCIVLAVCQDRDSKSWQVALDQRKTLDRAYEMVSVGPRHEQDEG